MTFKLQIGSKEMIPQHKGNISYPYVEEEEIKCIHIVDFVLIWQKNGSDYYGQ